MKTSTFWSLLIFAAIFSFPMTSVAQVALKLADSTNLPEVSLGEVQIKASKDKLKLNEMPVSVSLLPIELIEDNEIRSMPEISAQVPNFFMPDYGSKLTSPVYIRGIGSRIDAPSVGLYVDNVPYFEKASFDFDFFDVSGIEVLRGPQGTLFGRNTMGGIINVTTLSPFDYQGLRLKVSAATYGSYNLNAGYYGKVKEKLGYSFSGNYLHHNGFFTNAYSDDKVDEMDSYSFRLKLIWKIGDRFTAENMASYENSNQGGYPYAIYNDSLQFAQDINYNQYSYYDRKLFSDALVLKYKAAKFDFVATTAYQYLDDYQEIDQDFTPDSLFFVTQKQNQHMISQEIIMRSNYDGRYQWLTGVYAFRQMFDKHVDVDVYATATTQYKQYDYTNTGYALFHQSTIEDLFLENLALTAGIRIDFEDNELKYVYDVEKNDNLKNMADTLYPPLKYSAISPKFALNYLKNGRNYYITVTRGFKTGGYNSTFERPEDLTFGPEFSWNYEAGIKTPLFRNAAYINFAFFYIDWKNQQIYQTVPSGRGAMLKNAGHSASRGFELTVKTKSFAGIEPLFSYGYTYATFLENKLDSITDYSGNFIPYVPRHTAALNLSRSFPMKDGKWLDGIRVNLGYQGNGEIYWNDKNSHSQKFYGLLSAKVAFEHRLLRFEIWGKNLLDAQYESFYFEALGNKYVQNGKPLQVGVNLSINL